MAKRKQSMLKYALPVGLLVAFGYATRKKSGSTSNGSDTNDTGYGTNYDLSNLTETGSSYDNTPDNDTELDNIAYTSRMMDEVVTLIGYKPYVNSAYRSDAVNDDVGGVKTSYHLTGLAVDMNIGKSSQSDADEKLRILQLLWDSDLPLDEVIAYAVNSDGTNNPDGKSHIHLSFAKSGTGDREFLTTVSGSSGTFSTWTPDTFSNS